MCCCEQPKKLVAVVGPEGAIIRWFNEQGLNYDTLLVADGEDGTRYVGWHSPITDKELEKYDEVVYVSLPVCEGCGRSF